MVSLYSSRTVPQRWSMLTPSSRRSCSLDQSTRQRSFMESLGRDSLQAGRKLRTQRSLNDVSDDPFDFRCASACEFDRMRENLGLNEEQELLDSLFTRMCEVKDFDNTDYIYRRGPAASATLAHSDSYTSLLQRKTYVKETSQPWPKHKCQPINTCRYSAPNTCSVDCSANVLQNSESIIPLDHLAFIPEQKQLLDFSEQNCALTGWSTSSLTNTCTRGSLQESVSDLSIRSQSPMTPLDDDHTQLEALFAFHSRNLAKKNFFDVNEI